MCYGRRSGWSSLTIQETSFWNRCIHGTRVVNGAVDVVDAARKKVDLKIKQTTDAAFLHFRRHRLFIVTEGSLF